MDLFETIITNITKTGQIASQKMKNASDIFKVKEEIRSSKKEINTLIYKIGQTYMELHKDSCEPEYADYYREIKEEKQRIALKKKELQELREALKEDPCYEDFEEEFEDQDIMDAEEEFDTEDSQDVSEKEPETDKMADTDTEDAANITAGTIPADAALGDGDSQEVIQTEEE